MKIVLKIRICFEWNEFKMYVQFSILKISDGIRNYSLWYLNCTCLHTATDVMSYQSVYMEYNLIQCILLLFSAADLTEYQL
jgi:hypothetical protein